MQRNDQDNDKRGKDSPKQAKRLGTRIRGWLNSIADLAAFTFRQLGRRIRRFIPKGSGAQKQVTQLLGLAVVGFLAVAAVFFYSDQKLGQFSQEMVKYTQNGQEIETQERQELLPKSSVEGLATGQVSLGLSEDELQAELSSSYPGAVEEALARPAPERPETMSDEALAAMNLSKLAWPLQGDISTGFGWWRHPMYKDWRMHTGISIAAPVKAAVKASLPGRVSDIYHDNYRGTVVVVDHGGNVRTAYGNIQDVAVRLGSAVAQGQVIGRAAPQLAHPDGGEVYFEVRLSNEAIDPQVYLR